MPDPTVTTARPFSRDDFDQAVVDVRESLAAGFDVAGTVAAFEAAHPHRSGVELVRVGPGRPDVERGAADLRRPRRGDVTLVRTAGPFRVPGTPAAPVPDVSDATTFYGNA